MTKIKNIIVTGGNGFIGTNFIKLILEQTGISVLNIDKMSYASNSYIDLININNPRYHKMEKDINDVVIADLVGIDAIINIAAESHVDNSISGPMIFQKSNVEGTLNLLECVRKYESSFKKKIRFLQVSTDEVYGSLTRDEPTFTEDNIIIPNSPYSASKASADCFVRSYHETYGLDALITRCSNNYGPFQHTEKFIPKIITNIMKGEKIPVYGDGKQIRDWVHVYDHCVGILMVLLLGSRVRDICKQDDIDSAMVFNIGGNNELENIDIVHTILDYMGVDYDEAISYVTDRLGHDRRYGMDCGKIEKYLYYKPRMKFSDGMFETIKWYVELYGGKK